MAVNGSSYQSNTNPGLFLPTTSTWDISSIYKMDPNSPQFKDFIVRLYQNINNIVLVLNIKDSAYYTQTEFVNGQLFFPASDIEPQDSANINYRQVFRIVVNFGPLPNATTISVPHTIDINSGYSFTRIYGVASNTDGSLFLPLPYVSSSNINNNIELYIDDTNVNIITGADYSSYTTTYIILEYLKF